MSDFNRDANVGGLGEFFSQEPAPLAQHRAAALYQGEWLSPHDGTAIAVRSHARALSAAGVPVLLKSFTTRFVKAGTAHDLATGIPIDDEVLSEVGTLHRTTTTDGVFPLIKHLVVYSAEQLNTAIFAGYGRAGISADQIRAAREIALRSTVLYTVWERDSIDPEVAMLMSRVAECWVPCEQNAEMLRRMGVERVYVVPHPYEPADDIAKLAHRPESKTKKFYAIGRWEPRKGFSELIEAFCLAFPEGEETLTIKTSLSNWDGYPSPEETIERCRALGATESAISRVTIKRNAVNRAGILRLHYENNVYVCSSHGEAWCLPAFEAKVAGNRMVHVPYGGTADFAAEGDVAIDWVLAPVPPEANYGWNRDAQWAEFEVSDISKALLGVKVSAAYRPDWFEKRFSAPAVGNLMKLRIVALCAKMGKRYSEVFG